MLKIIYLKIIYLKFHLNFSGANETVDRVFLSGIFFYHPKSHILKTVLLPEIPVGCNNM